MSNFFAIGKGKGMALSLLLARKLDDLLLCSSSEKGVAFSLLFTSNADLLHSLLLGMKRGMAFVSLP